MNQYAEQEWLHMLAALHGRDAPVELSRMFGGDIEGAEVYPSRLFYVESDGSLIVERPSRLTLNKGFGVGDDIELVISQEGVRMVGTCTIREQMIRQINPTVKAVCFKLSPARRPQKEQRRAFYRVSTSAALPDPVTLTHADDGKPFKIQGCIVNLSGGGLGVMVQDKPERLAKLKHGMLLDCSVHLHDSEDLLEVPVRIARRDKLDAERLLLGLAFEPVDEQAARAVEDRLVRLSATFQRAQLNRRRA